MVAEDKTGKSWMAIGETDDPNAVVETFTADAAIVKGDPVYLSADDHVTPAGAAQDCIGIALKTVVDTGSVPVLVRGRVKVAAGGAITRGKAVYGADSSQRVLMLTDVSQAVDEGEVRSTLLRLLSTRSWVMRWSLLRLLAIFCLSRLGKHETETF
jgi:hypothetical protein